MHHTHEHSADKTTALPVEGAPLPLRADAPDLPECDPPQKDIHKTTGGKITDFFIYKVLGFGGNSALSVGVTYWINPKPQVENFRAKAKEGAQKLFKSAGTKEMVGNGMDIGFMLIAGTVLTSIMAPLVNRRDKIAYWVNQKLGKDTDVLPEHMQTHNAPLTLEDKVEQELKKRVTYGQTSGDLWKARWTAVTVPLFGDMALGKMSAKREAEGKESVDTLSWRAGQHLYDKVLPPEQIKSMGSFFRKHKAGIEDIRANNKDIYERLERSEKQHDLNNQKIHGVSPASKEVSEDRMMIADQTRLLGKEVGWTLVLSEIVEHLTSTFQNKRIQKQERKAIAAMREEGLIPAGVHATMTDGHVTLTKTKDYKEPQPASTEPVLSGEEGAGKQWANDSQRKTTAPTPEKAFSSHVDAVSQRALNQPQTSLV